MLKRFLSPSKSANLKLTNRTMDCHRFDVLVVWIRFR